MRDLHRSLRTAWLLSAMVGGPWLAPSSAALTPMHGGTYRTPPPLGTPGAAGEANTGGPSTTGGGVKHTDPAAWSQWWALSRDVYLPRHERVFDGTGSTGKTEGEIGAGLPVPEEVLRGLVVPALLLVLQAGDDVDLLTAALMALAKIGRTTDDEDPPDMVGVIARYLDHDDPEVAESAVVALGVLGDWSGAPLLTELLHDTKKGAHLVGERMVPERRRAYAAYGLAVLGARTEADSVHTFVAHHLVQELDQKRPESLDLSVACVIGLGLVSLELRVPAEGEEAPRPTASRAGQVAYLLSLLDERRFDDTLKSFVPVSAARLARDADPALAGLVGERLIELVRPQAKTDEGLRAAAIQALGLLGDGDADALDEAIREQLMKNCKEGGRLQRNLALLALGRVGGRAGHGKRSDVPGRLRGYLMERVFKGESSEKPWAALAVGLLEHGLVQQGADADETAHLALRQQFEYVGNPSFSGALAVTLGLCGDTEAVPLLIGHLTTGDETIRAHAATALGLMRAREALDPLGQLAGNGPSGIAREAAIALALCGDKDAYNYREPSRSRAPIQLGLATGLLSLAYFGDSRAVVPLVEVATDRRASNTVRAYAAVALGILCDKDEVPWNHPIAQDVVWWSAPPTLLDSAKGLGVVDFY